MSWTDERIETLRRLWEKGLTASQIAEKLGDVSRNAVIGKAHRLGLKSRPSPVKADAPEGSPAAEAEKKAAPPKKVAPAKAEPIAVADVAPADPPAPKPAPKPVLREAQPAPRMRAPGEKVTLLDLNERICKWPIGHPDEEDFHFCGKPVNPGFPYCTAHCAEAYQAQLPRDRSRSRSPMPPLPRPR